jgi:Protein of unknown function (DUF3263)
MLSDRDYAILDFELASGSLAHGAKGPAIREQFGIGPERYRQILTALCFELKARIYAPEVTEPWIARQPQRVRDGLGPLPIGADEYVGVRKPHCR